jgi:hypothetical protein
MEKEKFIKQKEPQGWETIKRFYAEYKCFKDVTFVHNGNLLFAYTNSNLMFAAEGKSYDEPICFGNDPDNWEALGKWLIQTAKDYREGSDD